MVEDLFDLLSAALACGEVYQLRLKLNGDDTLEYRVSDDLSCTILESAYQKLMEMMNWAAEDNLERPFFFIVDESNMAALDIVIGDSGSAGYCEHDGNFVLRAVSRLREMQELHSGNLKLSRGHSHPVFDTMWEILGYPSPEDDSTQFGCFPSNIFGSLKTWKKRRDEIDTFEDPGAWEARKRVIEEIITKEQYTTYCEDYLESYHASFSPGFNGPIPDTASKLHWIVTPRIPQIGVFEVLQEEKGVVVYHPWSIEIS